MNGLQEGYSDEHADATYHQHYQHDAGHELQHDVDVENGHEEDEEEIEGEYQQDEGDAEMIVEEEEEEEMQGATSSFSNVAQGLEGKHRDNMLQYWQETINSIEHEDHKFKIHQLPLARIKKVMKADEDVRMISAEAPILFAKGCDIFITELTMRAWIHAEESKRRTLQRSDIANALQKSDMFDFLIDIVPREEAMNSRRAQQYEDEAAAAAAAVAATGSGGEEEDIENGHELHAQEEEHEEKHDAEVHEHQEELSSEQQDHAGHDVAPGTTNTAGQEYVYQYADLDYNEGYRQY